SSPRSARATTPACNRAARRTSRSPSGPPASRRARRRSTPRARAPTAPGRSSPPGTTTPAGERRAGARAPCAPAPRRAPRGRGRAGSPGEAEDLLLDVGTHHGRVGRLAPDLDEPGPAQHRGRADVVGGDPRHERPLALDLEERRQRGRGDPAPPAVGVDPVRHLALAV